MKKLALLLLLPGLALAQSARIPRSQFCDKNGRCAAVSALGEVSVSSAGGSTQAVKITKAAIAPVTGAVTVATSATLLPTSVATNRVSLCIYNNGSATIFIGPSGVTTSNGWPVPAGTSWCDDVGAQVYYGIVATGTVEARVLEN